jgi:phospholipase A-2-activating protein
MTSSSSVRAEISSSNAQHRPAPYKLSALLRGHTDDVRCVTADRSSLKSTERLASTSRDGSARLWETTETPEGSREWRQACEWQEGHEGYVNAARFVHLKDSGDGESVVHQGAWSGLSTQKRRLMNLERAEYLATAGADSLIQVYNLSESPTCATNPSYTLLGHAHNVCALDVSGNGKQIASASWDMTARVWSWVGGEDGWNCTSVLVDHGAAVWDVLLIQKDPNILLTGTEAERHY